MRIRTIACSSSINLSWFSLILGWWVGVHWRCKLKFLLGCLCPLMAWWRVLLCLLAIRQLSWWSRKELHWNLHENFIFNGLGVSFVFMAVHSLTRHHRQTIDRECTPWCGGISSSWSLLPTCELVFLKMMKAGVLWLIRGGLHLASH